jgi:S1-C subfamily serine protease
VLRRSVSRGASACGSPTLRGLESFMMRRRAPVLLVALAVASLAACGGKQKASSKSGMTARDIIDQSSPAIVRIESGEAKVGTGFILSSDGLIATNLHVIEGESAIRVRLYKDPSEYPATVIVGVDKGHDLALLRIKAKKALPTLRLGDSSAVSAGDRIYAIGNPLGVFDYSITDGLISQVRPLSPELTILQISAAISQGSSGGPLFNQFGEVIGVTTAIITQGQAINLAVPANYLRPMIKQQQSISLDEFARVTKDSDKAHSTNDDADVKIERKIPDHPVTIWTGCDETQMEDILRSIGDAIAIGAPLYNGQSREPTDPGYDPKGFESCFRVYEGTSLRFGRDAACKGVRDAFVSGLDRAKAMRTYKEKAWALRDTFDGLINAFGRWCEQDAACKKKFSKPVPPASH